jgi:hypothetical protein
MIEVINPAGFEHFLRELPDLISRYHLTPPPGA